MRCSYTLLLIEALAALGIGVLSSDTILDSPKADDFCSPILCSVTAIGLMGYHSRHVVNGSQCAEPVSLTVRLWVYQEDVPLTLRNDPTEPTLS